MNDTYISKVTGTEASDGLLHHCGTESVCVEVECPMTDRLMYCPECEEFWEVDEIHWGDDKTKWGVEKPGPMSNFKELVRTKDDIISRMHGKLKVKDRLLSEAHRAIKEQTQEVKEQLKELGRKYQELLGKQRKYDDNEVRSRGPGKRGGRPESLNEPEKAV